MKSSDENQKKPRSRLEHKTTTKRESKVTNQTIHSLCFISTYNYRYIYIKKKGKHHGRGVLRPEPPHFPSSLSTCPAAPPANPNPPTPLRPLPVQVPVTAVSSHRCVPSPFRCVPTPQPTSAAPSLFPATAASPRRPAASLIAYNLTQLRYHT